MLNQFWLCVCSTTWLWFLPISFSVQAQPILADATLASEATSIRYSEASNNFGLLPSLQTSNRIFSTILRINTVNQITQTCSARVRNNSFTVIGRGGIASSSKEILNTTSTWIDWRVGESRGISEKLVAIQKPVVEATDWLDANGEVKRIASFSQIPLSHYTTDATYRKAMACPAMGGGSSLPK